MKQIEYRIIKGLFNTHYEASVEGKILTIIPESDCWRLVIDGHRTSYTRVHLKSMFNLIERKYNIKLVREVKHDQD